MNTQGRDVFITKRDSTLLLFVLPIRVVVGHMIDYEIKKLLSTKEIILVITDGFNVIKMYTHTQVEIFDALITESANKSRTFLIATGNEIASGCKEKEGNLWETDVLCERGNNMKIFEVNRLRMIKGFTNYNTELILLGAD